jgi:hypothetical protein
MLLLDSRVLADQQLNKRTQQRFASPAIEPLSLTRVAELKLRYHLIRIIFV